MRARLLPLVLALCLGLGARSVHAEVPRSNEDAATAWRRAHAADDRATARQIARATHLDPAALGAILVERQLPAGTPPRAVDALVAELEALRRDANERPGLDALDRLIARLAAADASVLARELRWIDAAKRIRALDLGSADGRAQARRIHARMRFVTRPPACRPVWWVAHRHARALHLAGEHRPAREAYRTAAVYAEAGGMLVPAARSRLASALFARAEGRTEDARTEAERSLAHAESARELRGTREAVTFLTNLALAAGDMDAAAHLVVTHMPGPAGTDRTERHAYFVMAFHVQTQVQRPVARLATAEHMLANARALGQPLAVAEALRSLGHACHALGRTADALRHLEAARAHDLSRRPRLARLIHAGLADIWNEVGRHVDAERSARAALALSRAIAREDDEAQDLLQLAQALGGQRRWDDALRYAQRALRMSVTSGSLRRMGEARREVAVLHWRAGQAAQAFMLLEASRAAFANIPEAAGEAYTLWLAGVYRVMRREFTQALVLAERSAALLHPAHGFHARIARLRAAALFGLGRHREAAAAAHAAIESSRRMLVGLAASDTLGLQRSLASAAGYGLRAVHTLASAADGEKADAWVDEAFWLMESSRAIQLNVSLREDRGRSLAVLPPELRRAEQLTQGTITALHRHLLAQAQAEDTTADALERTRRALDGAWAERERVVARIERVSRRAGVAAAGRPIARADLAALLRDDEAYVAWGVALERVVALVVRGRTRALVDVGARERIEADVAIWRRALATPGTDDSAIARRLHDALVAPLRAHLGDARRLIVSPGGALASIPLAALVSSPAPQATRLVETHELLYVPSATSYAILASEASATATPGRDLLVLAAPTYADVGLPALPHAAREAALVAATFPADRRRTRVGDEATLAALSAHLATRSAPLRALHVAAHAFVDPDSPARSGIVLAGGAMLRVDRVRRMHVPSDLVVLSCCDSAQGTPTAGEGQRGLVRAFLLAGARRVVASCWRVDDAATPDLMGRLYAGWQAQGHALPTALRAAQLERLRAGGRLAHPCFWASFVAWGLP